MSRGNKITMAFIAIVALIVLSIGGLQVWLWKSPLVVLGNTPGGELFDPETSVGRLPKDMDELAESIYQARSFDDCPAGLSWYVVHFENYGKPDAVLIEEAKDKHRTAFKLWIRGIHPQVQTMGDGTVRLFRDGKLATINAKK